MQLYDVLVGTVAATSVQIERIDLNQDGKLTETDVRSCVMGSAYQHQCIHVGGTSAPGSLCDILFNGCNAPPAPPCPPGSAPPVTVSSVAGLESAIQSAGQITLAQSGSPYRLTSPLVMTCDSYLRAEGDGQVVIDASDIPETGRAMNGGAIMVGKSIVRPNVRLQNLVIQNGVSRFDGGCVWNNGDLIMI